MVLGDKGKPKDILIRLSVQQHTKLSIVTDVFVVVCLLVIYL